MYHTCAYEYFHLLSDERRWSKGSRGEEEGIKCRRGLVRGPSGDPNSWKATTLKGADGSAKTSLLSIE